MRNAAHDGDVMAARYGAQSWRPDGTCTYCGGMSPATMVAAIEAGASVEAADRKYGWPAKFYVGGVRKFYAVHLKDASEFERGVIENALGIRYTFTNDAVQWSAINA